MTTKRLHSAGRAGDRRGQRGFVHILLVVLVTFGITVYGFLPSLEEALLSESRHEEKSVRRVNEAKQTLGGFALKTPGANSGSDPAKISGIERRYLMPCPDLPEAASGSTPYGSDGISEAGCQTAPFAPGPDDLLGTGWLAATFSEMREAGGYRAGFLPEQALNPYGDEAATELLFNPGRDELSRPLYLVSRNVVREDRPLNPTSLVRLPRTEWLSLEGSHYDAGAVDRYGLDARIAFMVIAPGDPRHNRCIDGAGRNTDGERLTDWTDLFYRDAGDCAYPPWLRLHPVTDAGGGAVEPTQDRIAYQSVEQLVTGGSGIMEDLEESGSEIDRIIGGDLNGFGIQDALEGYYRKHGFFPDPAAFDIGLGTVTAKYRHEDTEGADEPLPLAGVVPHSETLLRTGGIASTPVSIDLYGDGNEVHLADLETAHALPLSTTPTVHTLLKTRLNRVKVNLPEDVAIPKVGVSGIKVAYQPPFSTYLLDPDSRLDISIETAYLRIPVVLPTESAYRSVEPLGLQPRDSDILRATDSADDILAMTVRFSEESPAPPTPVTILRPEATSVTREVPIDGAFVTSGVTITTTETVVVAVPTETVTQSLTGFKLTAHKTTDPGTVVAELVTMSVTLSTMTVYEGRTFYPEDSEYVVIVTARLEPSAGAPAEAYDNTYTEVLGVFVGEVPLQVTTTMSVPMTSSVTLTMTTTTTRPGEPPQVEVTETVVAGSDPLTSTTMTTTTPGAPVLTTTMVTLTAGSVTPSTEETVVTLTGQAFEFERFALHPGGVNTETVTLTDDLIAIFGLPFDAGDVVYLENPAIDNGFAGPATTATIRFTPLMITPVGTPVTLASDVVVPGSLPLIETETTMMPSVTVTTTTTTQRPGESPEVEFTETVVEGSPPLSAATVTTEVLSSVTVTTTTTTQRPGEPPEVEFTETVVVGSSPMTTASTITVATITASASAVFVESGQTFPGEVLDGSSFSFTTTVDVGGETIGGVDFPEGQVLRVEFPDRRPFDPNIDTGDPDAVLTITFTYTPINYETEVTEVETASPPTTTTIETVTETAGPAIPVTTTVVTPSPAVVESTPGPPETVVEETQTPSPAVTTTMDVVTTMNAGPVTSTIVTVQPEVVGAPGMFNSFVITVTESTLLGTTLTLRTTEPGVGTVPGQEISAHRAFRSHMEMSVPPGMQVFAKAGVAELLVPAAAIDLQGTARAQQITVTVETSPGVYAEETRMTVLNAGDLYLSAYDGGLIDYELEADTIGVSRTPVAVQVAGPAAHPFPNSVPVRPGNKGLLPVDSILGDIPSQLDPDRDVARPLVDLNLFCTFERSIEAVPHSEIGDCPVDLGPAPWSIVLSVKASPEGTALRLLTAAETEFLVFAESAAAMGVMVEAFPYLTESDGSRDAFPFDDAMNPTRIDSPLPFRVPQTRGGLSFASPLQSYDGAVFPGGLGSNLVDTAGASSVRFKLPAGTQVLLPLTVSQAMNLGRDFIFPEGMKAVVPAGTRIPGVIAPNSVRPDGRLHAGTDAVVEDVELPRGGIVHFNNGFGMNTVYISPGDRASYSDIVRNRRLRNIGFEVMGEGVVLTAGGAEFEVAPGCTILPYRPAWHCGTKTYRLTAVGDFLDLEGGPIVEVNVLGAELPPYYRATDSSITPAEPRDFAFDFASANALGHSGGALTSYAGYPRDFRDTDPPDYSAASLRPPDLIADESTSFLAPAGSAINVSYVDAITGRAVLAIAAPVGTSPVVLNDYIRTLYGHAVHVGDPGFPNTFILQHSKPAILNGSGGYAMADAVAVSAAFDVTYINTVTDPDGMTPLTLAGQEMTLLLEPSVFRMPNPGLDVKLADQAMRSNFTAIPHGDMMLAGSVAAVGGTVAEVVRAGTPVDFLAASDGLEVRVRSPYGGGTIKRGLDPGSQGHARPKLRPHYEMIGIVRQATTLTLLQPYSLERYTFDAEAAAVSASGTEHWGMTVFSSDPRDPEGRVAVQDGGGLAFEGSWLQPVSTVTTTVTSTFAGTTTTVTSTTALTLSVVTVDIDPGSATVLVEAARKPVYTDLSTLTLTITRAVRTTTTMTMDVTTDITPMVVMTTVPVTTTAATTVRGSVWIDRRSHPADTAPSGVTMTSVSTLANPSNIGGVSRPAGAVFEVVFQAVIPSPGASAGFREDVWTLLDITPAGTTVTGATTMTVVTTETTETTMTATAATTVTLTDQRVTLAQDCLGCGDVTSTIVFGTQMAAAGVVYGNGGEMFTAGQLLLFESEDWVRVPLAPTRTINWFFTPLTVLSVGDVYTITMTTPTTMTVTTSGGVLMTTTTTTVSTIVTQTVTEMTTTMTVVDGEETAPTEFTLHAGARVLVPGRADYDYGSGALRTDRIVIVNSPNVYADPALQGSYEVLDFRSGLEELRDRGQPTSTLWAGTPVDLFPPLELTMSGLDMFAPSGGVLYRDLSDREIGGTAGRVTTIIDEIPAGGWLDLASGEQEWRGVAPGLPVEDLPAALATVVRDYPMAYAVAEECRRRHSPGIREFASECASGEGEGLNMQVAPGSWIDVPSDTPLASPMILVRAARATRDASGGAIVRGGQIGGYRIRGYDMAGAPAMVPPVAATIVGTADTLPILEEQSVGYDSAAWILVDVANRQAVIAHSADRHPSALGGGFVQGNPFTVTIDFAVDGRDDLVVLPLGYDAPDSEPAHLARTGLEVIFLHPDEDAADFTERLVNHLSDPAAGMSGDLDYEFSNAVRAVSHTPITLYPGGQHQGLDGNLVLGQPLAVIPATDESLPAAERRAAGIELAPAVLFRDGELNVDRLFEDGAWYGQRDLTGFRPLPGQEVDLEVDLDGALAYGYDYRGMPFDLAAPVIHSNISLGDATDDEEETTVFLDLSQELIMSPGYSWSGVIGDDAVVTFGVMPESTTERLPVTLTTTLSLPPEPLMVTMSVARGTPGAITLRGRTIRRIRLGPPSAGETTTSTLMLGLDDLAFLALPYSPLVVNWAEVVAPVPSGEVGFVPQTYFYTRLRFVTVEPLLMERVVPQGTPGASYRPVGTTYDWTTSAFPYDPSSIVTETLTLAQSTIDSRDLPVADFAAGDVVLVAEGTVQDRSGGIGILTVSYTPTEAVLMEPVFGPPRTSLSVDVTMADVELRRTETGAPEGIGYANQTVLFFRSYPDIDGIEPESIDIVDADGMTRTADTSSFAPEWSNDYAAGATTLTLSRAKTSSAPNFGAGMFEGRLVTVEGEPTTLTMTNVTMRTGRMGTDTRTLPPGWAVTATVTTTLTINSGHGTLGQMSWTVGQELYWVEEQRGLVSGAPGGGTYTDMFTLLTVVPTLTTTLNATSTISVSTVPLEDLYGTETHAGTNVPIVLSGASFRPFPYAVRPAIPGSSNPDHAAEIPSYVSESGQTLYYANMQPSWRNLAAADDRDLTVDIGGYAYGDYALDLADTEELSGYDAPFFGLGSATLDARGNLPPGQIVGSAVSVTATLSYDLTIPSLSGTAMLGGVDIEVRREPPQYDDYHEDPDGYELTLSAGSSFSLNRTNKMRTTLKFGDDFAIDGYASIWPRYDSDDQGYVDAGIDSAEGWASPSSNPVDQRGRERSSQQVYFERLSAGFGDAAASRAYPDGIEKPEQVWLVMPEPVREMMTIEGTMVSVYAGSMINPITGEVRLAQPWPVGIEVALSKEADAAVEGNSADRMRPIALKSAALQGSHFRDSIWSDSAASVSNSARAGFKGGFGNLCYYPMRKSGDDPTFNSEPNTLADETPFDDTIATAYRGCEASFDDMSIVFPLHQEPASLIGATVAWDVLAGAESWLLFDWDGPAAEPASSFAKDILSASGRALTSAERAEFHTPNIRMTRDLRRRMDSGFLKPARNVTNFRIPPGMITMPEFRTTVPDDIGYTFPPDTVMEAAAPEWCPPAAAASAPPDPVRCPGAAGPVMRTSAVTLSATTVTHMVAGTATTSTLKGGAGVPSIIRTPGGSRIGMSVSLSLGIPDITHTMNVTLGSVWDPRTTLGFEVNPSSDDDEAPIGYYFPKYYGHIPAAGTMVAATVRWFDFNPVAAMTLHAERDMDVVPEEFVGLEIRQNVWILINEDIVIDLGTEMLRLPEGTVLNPMFGTYLLPAVRKENEQGATRRLETRTRTYVLPNEPLELTRPALILPKGSKLYAARGASLRNVQAAVFFSPYPLEAIAGCATQLDRFDDRLDDSGFRLSQLTEGVSEGGPDRTYDPIGTGHICALLDTEENTDFDDWYTFYSASQRPRNSLDRRIEVNDRVYPVGGRLLGAFPNPVSGP